jgi:hypothetical protein
MFALIFLLYSLTSSANADQGSGIDPDGYAITVNTHEGPGMCPHGSHAPSMNAVDGGGAMDPNG